MTPQEIEEEKKRIDEEIDWLSERFVGYMDKSDFLENLKDILITNNELIKQKERQRIREELELLYVANPTELNFKAKVLALLSEEKGK